MGSIGSTLNSINQSLLSEIQSYSGKGTSTGTTTSASSTPTPDKIDISQAGDLFSQLQQLQTSNPTEFKQVLTDAAAKLKDAASQQTDPKAATFLDTLANRFQNAADTGDISALHPQSPSGGAVHGHHGHHGGGGKKTDSSTDSTTDDSDTSPTGSIANPSTTDTSTDPLSAAIGQSGQDLFSLLSTQSSSSNTDVLTAAFNALQASSTPGSTSNQISSLLGDFVTSST